MSKLLPGDKNAFGEYVVDPLNPQMGQIYFDTAAVMMLVLDRQGVVRAINKKGYSILGYEKSQDIVGRNWFSDFLPPDSHDELYTIYKKMMDTKNAEIQKFFVEGHVNKVVTKEGSLRQVRWFNSALRGADGKIALVISSGNDVTGEEKLRADLEEKVQLLERFKELSVGRELKMVEIKKELEELKAKCQK